MRDVVLLYERSCPNVQLARANLLRAFSLAKLPASWREVDLEASDTPAEWTTFGSPTIVVDGRDVGGGTPGQGATCRLYEQDGRLTGAPSAARIAAALGAEAPRREAPTPRSALAAAPGLAIALLPKAFCPACWPAYAAALTAVGLGFLMQASYLVPITIGFLAVATLAIAHRAPLRRGYTPAIVAALASVSLVVAKFALESSAGTYAATAVFAAAAIWNAWPLRRAAGCTACVPERPTAAL